MPSNFSLETEMFDNFNEHANKLLAALKQQATEDTKGETLEFRQCQRPNGSTYGTRGQCRKGTETQQPTRERAPKRFGDKEAGKVAKRGKEASTKARAEKVLADLKPALPSKLNALQALANGTRALPKDQSKRKELYEAAHKRLGQLGNNPYNPQQRLDGKDPERQALSGVLRRLDPEFNPARRLTRDQVLKAVGTVD